MKWIFQQEKNVDYASDKFHPSNIILESRTILDFQVNNKTAARTLPLDHSG